MAFIKCECAINKKIVRKWIDFIDVFLIVFGEMLNKAQQLTASLNNTFTPALKTYAGCTNALNVSSPGDLD
ncbi:hypothetical protein A9G42_08605 [Gilliamella sp. Nev6-6]|nr:hypothetical protein A9G42_08605 [Gilliamella apicola]